MTIIWAKGGGWKLGGGKAGGWKAEYHRTGFNCENLFDYELLVCFCFVLFCFVC